jgi:hypothetical protein
LAVVFGVAGVTRLTDRVGFREAVRSFGVPLALAGGLAIVLPPFELLVAGSLLPAGTALVGALAALAVLVVFAVGIVVALARGRQPECHCSGQLHSATVTWRTLLRDVALIAATVFVVVVGRSNAVRSATGWIGSLDASETAGLLGGTVFAAELLFLGWFSLQLRHNGRLLHGSRRSKDGLTSLRPRRLAMVPR